MIFLPIITLRKDEEHMKSKTEKLIRRFEISLAAAFVITSIFSFVSFAASCSDVRRDVLRMHVIANSDSDEDQILKLKVRDAVLNEGEEIFDGSLTSANAEKLLSPQKERLEETAREVIRKNGFDYDVRLEIGKDFFSTRTYDDRITLPAGEYEAVRVIIGEGKGKNWWCVMFPPMCLPAAESSDDAELQDILSEDELKVVESNPKFEPRFKIIEIYEKLTQKLK